MLVAIAASAGAVAVAGGAVAVPVAAASSLARLSALIIRVGFGGILYYNHSKEPPPPKKKNSIGNYLGPYIKCLNESSAELSDIRLVDVLSARGALTRFFGA